MYIIYNCGRGPGKSV